MNQENNLNAHKIAQILEKYFIGDAKKQVRVLDICCGVFDSKDKNYDPKGDIYEPLVAEKLAQLGYDVTGVDFRENDKDGSEIKEFQNSYTHLSNINILEDGWEEKLEKAWNVLIFLRSWDTPEILLHYQKTLDIDDLNLLSLEIAKIYLPVFADLLVPNALFFTTDICNFGLCEDDFETQLYKNQVLQLIKKNGLELVDEENGLYCFKKNIEFKL